MIVVILIVQSIFFTCIQKLQRISGIVTFIGIALLMSYTDSRYISDYALYLNSYTLKWNNFERGYTMIANYFEALGISYFNFRLVVLLIVCLAIAFTTSLFTKQVAFVSVVYAISLYPIEISQVRNAMVIPFILLSIHVLLSKMGKKYFMCILILVFGSFFHTLALTFLLIPIFWSIKKYWKNNYSFIFGLLILVATFLQLYGKNLLLKVAVKIASLIGLRSNLSENLQSVYSKGTQILPWLLTLLFIMGCFILWSWLIQGISKGEFKIETVDIIDLGSLTILMMAIGLIFMSMSVDYIRFIRIIFLIFVIIFTVIMGSYSYNNTAKIFFFAFLILLSLLLLYIQVSKIYLIQDLLPYLLHLINPDKIA